ncbi:MAG: hypothetical protein ACK55I_26950, partial [bacterium]
MNRGAQRGQNPVFVLAQAAAVTGARRRGGRLQERAGAGRGGEKEVHERRQNETGQSALRVFINSGRIRIRWCLGLLDPLP